LNRPAAYLSGIALALLLVSCSYIDQWRGLTATEEANGMAIQLTSTAFAEGKPIPVIHTCDGEDISPPLSWSNVPAGANSLALIGDDPDAPGRTWVHWVVYGIPPNVSTLPQAVPTTDTLANGAKQGTTDFGRVGYGGPCPPKGKAHRYFFKLYALDSELPLKDRATKQDVLNAMQGHILAEGQLIGTYQRK
jgi:Raf kinase inhibitor-like YbhB/YbcL family protein